MVTVEDESSIKDFKDFSVEATSPVAVPAPAAAAPASVPAPAVSAPVTLPSNLPSSSTTRVFASPLARKLAKEQGLDVTQFNASGPNNRIIAADILNKNFKAASAVSAVGVKSPSAAVPVVPPSAPGVFADFVTTPEHQELAAQLTHAKQIVPHYYLSGSFFLCSHDHHDSSFCS